MTNTADIRVPVDLSNPGQFFACCGLLELATRMWRSSEIRARFEPCQFLLDAGEPSRPLAQLLSEFAKCRCDQLDPKDNSASPLRLSAPFDLRLDWWCAPDSLGGGNALKTWAGRQSGPLIFSLMRGATARAASAKSPLDCCEAVYDVKDGKARDKTISPFYFDSRRSGTSQDFGFAPDEQEMSVDAFPAVESLALIGLQRFRPRLDRETRPRTFVYSAWAEFLSAPVAAATVGGAVRVRSQGDFRFRRPSRGGEYVTMFSRATREKEQ